MTSNRRLPPISRGRRFVSRKAAVVATCLIFGLCALIMLDDWLANRQMGIGRLWFRTLCFLISCSKKTRPLHALMPKSTKDRFRIRLAPRNICPNLLIQPPPVVVPDFIAGNEITTDENFRKKRAGDNFSHQPKTILAVVQSAPSDRIFRNAVRATWGAHSIQRQLSMRVLFLLGFSAPHDKAVIAEHAKYNDILQVDVSDSYINVTLKVIGAFQWITDFCITPTTRKLDGESSTENLNESRTNSILDDIFLLKTDDDMVVDVFRLRSFLDYEWKLAQLHAILPPVVDFCRTIYCAVHVAAPLKPVRFPLDRTSTFYDEWQPQYFPPSCYGGGYGFSLSLLPELYAGVIGERYNRHEDILFTGIIVEQLNNAQKSARKKIMLKTFNKTDFDFWPVHVRPSDMMTMGETFYHTIRNIATFTEQWLYLEQYYRTHPILSFSVW